MPLWLVRAGKHGERENLALEKGAAIIGWGDVPDLSGITDRGALEKLLTEVYPDEKPKRLSNWESQLWPIVNTIQPGDLVVLPLKTRSMIAIGKVTGSYQYRSDIAEGGLHTRPVKWLKEVPRSAFDQDLLYSFGAFMTVCRIQRGQAEERVRAVAENRAPQTSSPTISDESTDYTAPPDLEENARDQIREYIARKFRGHELATLVAAVLEVQGYKLRHLAGRAGWGDRHYRGARSIRLRAAPSRSAGEIGRCACGCEGVARVARGDEELRRRARPGRSLERVSAIGAARSDPIVLRD